MIVLIIYILGIIATLWAFYYSLKSGEEVDLLGLSFSIASSLFSWVTFIILILVVYGDKIVFTKK
jgi:hypothetical protein